MKLIKRFIGIFLAFSFMTISVSAQISDEDISLLLNDINSVSRYEELDEIISSGMLDELCVQTNGYTGGGGGSNRSLLMQLIFNEIPYYSAQTLADTYAAACEINSINSAAAPEDLLGIISSGMLDELCAQTNGYSGGSDNSDTQAAVALLFNGRPYNDAKYLADTYAAACIINSSNYAILKEYIENGFLSDIIGISMENYIKLSGTKQAAVIKECSGYKYVSLGEFAARFTNAVKMNSASSGGGGGSSSGSINDAAIILESNGSIPESIIDGNEYIIRYSGASMPECILAAAVYDSGGRMKSVSLTGYSGEQTYAEFSAPLSSGDTVKIIPLESLESMTPVKECETIKVSEYKSGITYYEGTLRDIYDYGMYLECTSVNGQASDVHISTTEQAYRYLGHSVRIIAYGYYTYSIEDLTEYDTVTLNSNQIENISASQIVSKTGSYEISSSAAFFEDGRSCVSEPSLIGDFEIILSKPAGSEKWDSVNILYYESGVVEYIGDGIYTENGIVFYIKPYTEVVGGNKDEIAPGSVISYCRSLKAYISTSSVSGRTEITEDGFAVIGGNSYKLYYTAEANEYYDEFTAYIDVFGNAVKLVPNLSEYKAGLVTSILYTENGTVYIEYMDENGEKNKYAAGCDILFNDIIISPENTAEIVEFPLYAKICIRDGNIAKLVLKSGTQIRMKYSSDAFVSNRIITDDSTIYYAGENYRLYTRDMLKNAMTTGHYADCLLFFEEDNPINPVCVYLYEEPTVIKLMIVSDVDTDNCTISGFIDGEYVCMKVSENMAGNIEEFTYTKLVCTPYEIIGYTEPVLLNDTQFTAVDSAKEVFTSGNVLKITDSYIVFGGYDWEYSIAQLADNVNVYTFDGEKIEKTNISAIVADPNRYGYGSYIQCMHTFSGKADSIIIYNAH